MRVLLLLSVAAVLVAAHDSRPDGTRDGLPRVRCVEQPGVSVGGAITGYTGGKTIYLALYNSKAHFDNAQYCRNRRIGDEQLSGDTVRYRFDSLPAGEYLVAAFQDTDGDGKMARGLFGIPKEPYRIYRRTYGMLGPSFDKCSFRVEADYDTAHLDFGN